MHPRVLKSIALGMTLISALASAVTGPTLAGAAPAARRSSCGGWTMVPSSTSSSLSIRLRAVAAASATNAWAVGYYADTINIQHTLIELWNGATWTLSPSPGTLNDLQGATRVPGTSQLWAVGSYANNGNAIPLIERYC